MSGTPAAVLFDVDGTLVDSNYLHAVCWWEAFAQAGHDVPMAPIHRVIGMGSDQLLDALLPGGGIGTATTASGPRTARCTRPTGRGSGRCPGRRTCCAPVRSAPSRWSWPARRTPGSSRRCAPRWTPTRRSTGSTSSADVERSKPAPDLVQVALDKVEVPPDAAVFVGDTVWDVRACGKAGVPCIGLLSGGIGRAELLDAGAAEVYDGPAELLGALPRSILSGR